METQLRRPANLKRPTRMIPAKKKTNLNALLFLPLALVFIEWITRLFVFGFSFDSGIFYTFLTTCFVGVFLCFVISFIPQNAQFGTLLGVLGFAGFYHSFQMIYHSFFAMYFSYEMLGFAGAATKDFAGNIIICTLQGLYKVVAVFIPFIALILFRKQYSVVFPKKNDRLHKISGILALFIAVLFFLTAFIPKNPRKTLLYMRNDNAQTFKTFGMFVGTLDDICQTVFGSPEEIIDGPDVPWTPPEEDEKKLPEDFASRVTLSIPCEFNLYLDEKGNVIFLSALDEDALKFENEIEWKNFPAKAVVDSIIVKASEKGFVTDETEILIQIAKKTSSPLSKSDISHTLKDIIAFLDANLKGEGVKAKYKGEILSDIDKAEEEPVQYGLNELGIDYDALIESAPNAKIKDLHQYFKSVPATKKNQYTGLFEGKNLIFITLEGFSYKAIDEKRTPILYKMYNEGFKFTNFYNSTWGGSTATGEYTNMTGNFYKSANCLKLSSKTLTYSALGNLFGANGYSTMAYHDHTYTYYDRNVSHPNFGYTFKAIQNGLKLPTSHWPNSDHEMAQVTGPEYIRKYLSDKVPFHTYYMSVSGHANYTFLGNSMSTKHKNIVKDLDASEGIKAYFACQYEVELMLQELISQLDQAGILQDTVFAMGADHYPFGLSDEDLASLYGVENSNVRGNLDIYRNAFILWCDSMTEPVIVDEPCSAYDIVPTLANLFGIPFESRVITGTDILSTTDNIAIINPDMAGGTWSWATKYGRYNTSTKKFTPSDEWTFSEADVQNYVDSINTKVSAMKKYSWAILDQNYYSYVFDQNFKPLKTIK